MLRTPLLATSSPSAHPVSPAPLTTAEASALSRQGFGNTSEAEDYFPPVTSAVVVPHEASPANPSLTKADREQFVREHLPTRVQAQLDQPYGKDTLSQSFYMPAHFRFVLLPLFKSRFLCNRSRKSLESSWRLARRLAQLLKRYRTVDFRPLQGFYGGWQDETDFNRDRQSMATACCLHFNGDVASVVRYIGGPHVGAHRNTDAILKRLAGKIDDEIHSDLTRIFTSGSPAYCNAESTEANFQEYVKYGNHKSMEADPVATRKSLLKESKRGYVLLMDPQILQFLLHAHITPNGIIGADHPTKSPRVIFDSTFRPTVWSSAINDWTSKHNEPPLAFASSFNDVLVWIWNLRISYPALEIYLIDDDVAGAFRHIKYHPNMVAMHCFQALSTLFLSTGQTFGDNTSPQNWEPVARARQQFAQYLWHQPTTLARVKPYMPSIQVAAQPPASVSNAFVQAVPDAIHSGARDATGQRRAPCFRHHVDDNLYADVAPHVEQAVGASVLSLYEILGFPDARITDALSRDKFEARITHERRFVGHTVNSRTLTVSLPQDKRTLLVAAILPWLNMTKFGLLEAGKLHGQLGSASTTCRWARATFFGLQNALRRAIAIKFCQVRAYYARSGRRQAIAGQLPANLWKRLEGLVSRDIADLMWRSSSSFPMTDPIRSELRALHDYLADPSQPWSISIGHLITRSPTSISIGDASQVAGGAYCEPLCFWFDIMWSAYVRDALHLHHKHPRHLHINCLEFVIVILQLAAVITLFESPLSPEVLANFPNGVPSIPNHLSLTDNMSSKAWANKVCTSSVRGQMMLSIYAALLCRTYIGFNCDHLPGIDNPIADMISRPDESLSPAAWRQQIYHREKRTLSWSYFQPSPELLSLLFSRLSTEVWLDHPKLPKTLGRFVATASTTSCSSML